MMGEHNKNAESTFDTLSIAQRSAIGAHVTRTLKAEKTGPKDFIPRFVAECERIASNPEEVAAIVAAAQQTVRQR